MKPPKPWPPPPEPSLEQKVGGPYRTKMPTQRAQELYQRLSYRVGWVVPPPEGAVLDMYVLYDRPRDASNHFVVRRWFIVQGRLDAVPGEARQADTLDGARKLVPIGRYRMDKHGNDDPTIVEVWV